MPKKPAKAPAGDPNDRYNAGLRLMKTIEAPLRDGDLDAKERKVADEAEQEFLAAIDLAPNHARAMIMIGMLYRFTGRFKEAIPHLEGALGLPRDCDDWTKAVDSLAGVHMQTGQHKKAVKLLEDALKDHADDPYLVVKLAACHDALEKPKEALKVLEAGLKSTPGNPLMTAALSEIKDKLRVADAQASVANQPPEAKALQDKAMKLGQALQKKMESIMNGKASAEEQAKQMAAAQAEYQAAVMKLYQA